MKHSLLISSVWVPAVILYLIKIWRAMIQNGNRASTLSNFEQLKELFNF